MNKKRITINMLAQMISLIIGIGINFILTPFITKQVGKEVYGFINLAFQMTGYVTIITTALNAMLGRYVMIKMSQKDYKSASMYFTSVTIVNMIFSVVLIFPVVFLILGLEYIINIPVQYVADIKLLWLFILGGFIASLGFEAYGVSGFVANRLDLISKRSIEGNIGRVILIVILYTIFPPKVWYFGIVYFLICIFIIITNVSFRKKLTPELELRKKHFNFKAVKELINIGVWNSINQLSNALIGGLDMIITNVFIGATSMALMGFAKSIPLYMIQFVGVVSGTFSPELTKTYAEGDNEKFQRQIIYSMKICGFICAVPIMGLICFGDEFFRLWLPVLSDKEVGIVQILSVLTLMHTAFDVHLYPLYSVNGILCKLRLPVFINFGVGIINVVGTILLLKYTNLGIYAVQIVSTTCMVLKVILFTPIYGAKIQNLKWYTYYPVLLRGVLGSAIILSLFIVIRNIFKIDGWMSFVPIVILAGGLGYIINFMVILDKEEKTKVITFIKKKMGRKNEKIL